MTSNATLPHDFGIGPELIELTETLADWADGFENFQITLFGSRVRGDHQSDSDVDVVVRWHQADSEFSDWWTEQNDDLFRDIDAKLPGSLSILEYDDPIRKMVLEARVVYVDRNVRCVVLPPKQITK